VEVQVNKEGTGITVREFLLSDAVKGEKKGELQEGGKLGLKNRRVGRGVSDSCTS